MISVGKGNNAKGKFRSIKIINVKFKTKFVAWKKNVCTFQPVHGISQEPSPYFIDSTWFFLCRMNSMYMYKYVEWFGAKLCRREQKKERKNEEQYTKQTTNCLEEIELGGKRNHFEKAILVPCLWISKTIWIWIQTGWLQNYFRYFV